MDYVQTMKEARAGGERLASVLEGVGQLICQEMNAARGADKKALRRVLAAVNAAFDIARDEDL